MSKYIYVVRPHPHLQLTEVGSGSGDLARSSAPSDGLHATDEGLDYPTAVRDRERNGLREIRPWNGPWKGPWKIKHKVVLY